MTLKTTLEEQERVRSFFHRYTGLNPTTLNYCDDFDTLKIEVVRLRSHARGLEQSLDAERRCSQSLRDELVRKNDVLLQYALRMHWGPSIHGGYADRWLKSNEGFTLAHDLLFPAPAIPAPETPDPEAEAERALDHVED